MLSFFSNKFTTIKHNLSSLDDKPIGKAALVILFLLDVFILVSIFDGLSDHTRQLTHPSQVIPQVCRDIVIEDEWNKTSRLTKLSSIISLSRGNYYLQDERRRAELIDKHSGCESITNLLLAIENDDIVAGKLSEWLNIKREISQLNATLKQVNSAYDTSLLENIAGQNQRVVSGHQTAQVESLKKDFALKTNRLNQLVSKQGELELSLSQDENITALFGFVDNVTEADKVNLRDDLRQLNFWYPVKRLGMEMIFLLPLFFIFYFWNKKSLTADRPFQSLVSSHLLVIVFIPVLFKIAELIYDIIPKTFLKQFIELLESLKLVALWHYLMMALIILTALALIYFFQKKLFSQEKLLEKRISKGQCQDCGKHLPANTAACPFCGFEQFKSCAHCNKPTYVFSKFCKECGHRH
jgi:hypothetical protein